MSPDAENEWKVKIATETYKKIGEFEWPDLKIFSNNTQYNYRNKIEYSFSTNQKGELSLAFFERASHYKRPISTCCLANENINIVAKEILTWARKQKLTPHNLKSVIVRSNQKGEVIAGLFIKDEIKFTDFPTSNKMIGFQLFYSTHKSPASVPTKELYSAGQKYLEEKMNGIKMRYGLFSFFQINLQVFTQTLKDIARFIPADRPIVDYYCGVGAIGLVLKKTEQKLELVENNSEAIECAKENIKLNNFAGCTTICQPAEKIIKLITGDKTIIFDPPRAGLDKKIIEQILNTLPETIVYLSCNLSTQARDLAWLLPKYKIEFIRLYNFFPRTDHIEGLVILKRLI
jgi:tRNA/tmRNA/rRNA uracil-C5-methylase (TrmA/RlmC/RlmD family)